ncbi:MAG: A/G-specific adenine glycosylase [Bdellovibrionaceae bacterium]|nr:A/G-specific adenine glycosylase [Pseudobdellovibrionaceae bacterium]
MALKAPKTHDIHTLENWFRERQRPLPWRTDRDPYKIWISEIMLQQTTTAAVIPYFERFMHAFPDVQSLAKAPLEKVYELWTGLGYYSRARNIHKAAQIFATEGFSSSYEDLLKVPGIGPYASRAISSQAFGERVGVVDGNVIRVYTRLFNFSEPWWNRKTQVEIQNWSDALAQKATNPSDANQALMELGATVCTPKSPTCMLCPWSKDCLALQQQTQNVLPIKKSKKQKEIWLWQPQMYIHKDQILLVHNKTVSTSNAKPEMVSPQVSENKAHYTKTSLPTKAKNSSPAPVAPLFLNNKWVPPGDAQKLKTKPQKFDYKHNITHHEIYVDIQKTEQHPHVSPNQEQQMVVLNKVKEISPFSLVQKAIQHIIK